jgi:Raf kinase inhibitor-like YbhB/YbcL family protein
MSLSIEANAFGNGSEIPKKFTCDGNNVSPALNWKGVSRAARSLALIADDPDAPGGTWTHWLLWNLPVTLTSLQEGLSAREKFENGAVQGQNDFSRAGYGGPCPPPGKPHRYFFKLYELDATLALRPGSSRKELERAMKGHILSQTEWMGRYGR